MADNSAFLNPDIWKTGQVQLADGQPPAGAGSPTVPASFGGPVPPGQVPPPSVNPGRVYRSVGKGYNPNELQTAWGTDAFRNDPAMRALATFCLSTGPSSARRWLPLRPRVQPGAESGPQARDWVDARRRRPIRGPQPSSIC
jgi:hypothetical protein